MHGVDDNFNDEYRQAGEEMTDEEREAADWETDEIIENEARAARIQNADTE